MSTDLDLDDVAATSDVATTELMKLRGDLADALRWKSTTAPRIESLKELLAAAQHEAAQGREAVATLESERAANAALTDELAAAIEQARREMRESCARLVEEAIANPMISLHALLAAVRSRSEK